MFERILVPLDGSDRAEFAIPYAVAIAARSSAEVILVGVSEAREERPQLYQAYLDRAVSRVQEDLARKGYRGRGIRSSVVTGNAAAEILHVASHEDAGLIALSGRGSTGQSQWPLGNVASKVLQSSYIPVLLVKGPHAPGDGDRPPIRKILLPLDTSEPGAAAVPYAAEIARLFGASVVLFHVEAPPRPWLIAPGVEFAYLPLVTPGKQAKQILSHIDYLDQVGDSLRQKGITVERDAGAGPPAAVILQYSRSNEIDLVALSTHGLSGVAEFVYGGVTEKMLQAGDVPVLVVRPGR
ncbi:MAG: universal stress protein [Chloroflexi bacterium]|nr:universal stress protein [Chloroflexota bacterium]